MARTRISDDDIDLNKSTLTVKEGIIDESDLMSNNKSNEFISKRTIQKEDDVRIYKDRFVSNDQLKTIIRDNGKRIIYIDPEVVYQMARLGLTRDMVAAYWGLNKNKFLKIADEYPEIEESYLMGMSAGIIKTATKLDEMVSEKQVIPTIFRMKISGFIEADKKKEVANEAPKVNIFLPDNSRD